ncbi:PDDEXK nuclease domain-containing protein [Spirosoma migulaei]
MNPNHSNALPLFGKIADLIGLARQQVVTTVNLTMVRTYFEIGRTIVEDEQQGNTRAQYGKAIITDLAKRLTDAFGKGFSVRNLEQMRQFYLTYSIPQTVPAKLQQPRFQLSWSHYLILMRIDNSDQRRFYELECAANNWSLRELQRQYSSSLYERLALSRDKAEVQKLAQEGQQIINPQDVLKNPYVLEFLGLNAETAYSESHLETRIIDEMQHFLLELGKGFLFEARQKRFTFNEDHFFVDLVFYNRLLQCYVLIDLKTDKLVHQDLGQMQMYVNYYDRYVKLDHEKPTLGILLCKQKNDALVELTLPKDANIYASEYKLYLPDKQLLQQKLLEWTEDFDTN